MVVNKWLNNDFRIFTIIDLKEFAFNSSSCHLAVHFHVPSKGVTTTRCIEQPQVATREYNKRVAVQQKVIHQAHRRAVFRFIKKLIMEQFDKKNSTRRI